MLHDLKSILIYSSIFLLLIVHSKAQNECKNNHVPQNYDKDIEFNRVVIKALLEFHRSLSGSMGIETRRTSEELIIETARLYNRDANMDSSRSETCINNIFGKVEQNKEKLTNQLEKVAKSKTEVTANWFNWDSCSPNTLYPAPLDMGSFDVRRALANRNCSVDIVGIDMCRSFQKECLFQCNCADTKENDDCIKSCNVGYGPCVKAFQQYHEEVCRPCEGKVENLCEKAHAACGTCYQWTEEDGGLIEGVGELCKAAAPRHMSCAVFGQLDACSEQCQKSCGGKASFEETCTSQCRLEALRESTMYSMNSMLSWLWKLKQCCWVNGFGERGYCK